MSKMIFKTRKRRHNDDPSLVKILGVLVGVIVVVYLGLQLWSSLAPGGAASENVEASPVTSLDEAASRLESGDTAAAAAMLEGVQEEGLRKEMLLAKLDTQKGDANAAISRLDAALKAHASSADQPAAALQYARLLEQNGRHADAEPIYEQMSTSSPAPFRAAALSGLARKAERGQTLVEARDLYGKSLRQAELNGESWLEAIDGLGRLNTTLIFSPQETPETKYYAVESGDTLTDIGIKLNTTQGLLTRANGITEQTVLRLGQRLKYTPKDFRIIVERSTCRLFLLDKEGLFKMYHTGLGMPGYETALGKYTIGNKQKDPVWFKPGGSPVPAGDPQNELGTRWMPLVPVAEGLPQDLGIHGTIAPETIGQYKSHGCPRMLKEDVEELYDLVVRSTPVEIVETIDWQTLKLS